MEPFKIKIKPGPSGNIRDTPPPPTMEWNYSKIEMCGFLGCWNFKNPGDICKGKIFNRKEHKNKSKDKGFTEKRNKTVGKRCEHFR
jgi:hypothetical protein